MRSTTSFFSVSPALIRENLRRFWAIPAFGFIGYFFSGVFPLLMSGDGSWYYTMRSLLDFHNPGFVILNCLFPLIAAIVLQRYLYAPGAVAAMHAMPFTRPKLFNGNFVSGLLMVWLPLIAVCLFCVLMKKPGLDAFLPEAQVDWAQYASAAFILSRFALMLLSTFFVYAVCVLAGMVAGNTPMHLIVCGLLNGILPAVALLGFLYCDAFLFGFEASDTLVRSIASLSPAIFLPYTGGDPRALAVVVYIAAGIALYAFANVLYARRPLEKAGDSLVFPFMELVFCFFAALSGMTAMAFYMEIFYIEGAGGRFYGGEASPYFYVGMAVGAAICFAVARMIVKKTPRVWNRDTALQFGAFALVALLLFAGLRFDLYGYERRVPAAAGVASVNLRVPSMNYDAILRPGEVGLYTFREAANVEAITAFHGRIAENRNALRTSPLNSVDRNDVLYVNLRYALSSGAPMSRSWRLPFDFCAEDESLRAVVESEEFRAQNSLSNPEIGKITDISLEFANLRFALSSDAFDAFVSAVNADLRLFKYEGLFDNAVPLAQMDIRYQNEGDSDSYKYLPLNIPYDFANTVAWLSANGYYDRLTAWRASVRSIRLNHVTRTKGPSGYEESVEEVAVLRDPALIRAALDGAERMILDSKDHWSLIFSMPPAEAVVSDGAAEASNGAAEASAAVGEPEAAFSEYANPENEIVLHMNPGNPALDALLAAVGEES